MYWTNCLHIQCKSWACQCTVKFSMICHNYYNKRGSPFLSLHHNDVQGSLFKTWYMWNIKCMEYQMYWIYFLHKLYSVQVEHVILPTPPLQKSTMMSPGRWIASTAVARFSSCWHFLWWRFFGRSTNVYNCPKKICSSEGEWRIFFYSFCLNVCCFTTFKESINWWIFTPQFVTYRSSIFMQPLNFI